MTDLGPFVWSVSNTPSSLKPGSGYDPCPPKASIQEGRLCQGRASEGKIPRRCTAVSQRREAGLDEISGGAGARAASAPRPPPQELQMGERAWLSPGAGGCSDVSSACASFVRPLPPSGHSAAQGSLADPPVSPYQGPHRLLS